MKISKNSIVTLSCQLHANFLLQEKKNIETTDASHPFTFLFGVGGLIPGFEQNLQGLTTGKKFDFQIESKDAYGDSDANAIMDLPIDIFKVDNVIDFEVLKSGNILPMSDHEGNQMNGKVVSYTDQVVAMYFNHPLAGQKLHFVGEVVDV